MYLRITCLLILWFGVANCLLAQQKMGTVSLPAGTERRVALVVGNRDYESLTPLRNPLNDADDMAQTLRGMGFAVTILKNTDYRTLGNGITSFISQLSGSDVALFYFSGHGVGYNGQNYIMPVNASVDCLERIVNEGISIEKILDGFEDRHVRNSFVFLDACRNLPNYPGCYDQSRNASPVHGLSIPKNNPRGSFIAFATAEGRTADDNQRERNGLFTSELKRFLPQPNIGIRTIMDSVSAAVRKRSNQKQQPKRYEDLEADFYFLTSLPPTPTTIVAPATTPTPLKPGKTTYLDLPLAELVYVSGGTFKMGNSQAGKYSDELPVHLVEVNSFMMGKFEVTQRQWEAVMGTNPSLFNDCPDCPVESVSWDDIQVFLTKLNARTGGNYRLPTEAEWEYAAGGGAGSRTLFGNGKSVLNPSEANFDARKDFKASYSVAGTYRGRPMHVGHFLPNRLGLQDMTGNVWEWCSDLYGQYADTAQINPTGATTGNYRVLRGGSYNDSPEYMSVFYRREYDQSLKFNSVGFRIVSSAK